MASSQVTDKNESQDDFRKAKQLQEARAAGTAAPETDAATGKIINPHNPMFITAAPWYLNQNKPSLQHQQAWNLKAPGSKDWYKRGTKGDVKTKFLKGACENCGAMTHTKKDCVERPRKVTAKKNGKNLMPDEFIDNLDLDYEGKRDRWNGYQADDYKEVIEEWEKVEEERRSKKAHEQEERAKMKEKFKAQKKALKKKRKQRRRTLRRIAEGREDDTDSDASDNDSDTDTDTDSDSDASDDEDLGEKMKDFDKNTNAVATKDDKLRTTTRNLRIREDTAKYLLNLDVNSAFYDPKSRSMRQNPLAHLKDEDQGAFKGDNYVRHAGDTKKLAELTVFAWDAYKHGEKIHDFAQPTQAAQMHNIFKKRSDNLKDTQQKELLEKYGGEEHLEAPREIIFSQEENYVEYSRDGRVLKGRERAYEKSKYEEDVMVGNHTSIWGSYFDVQSGRFGYKCCRQLLRNSYCIPIKKADTIMDAPGADETAAGSSAAADDAVVEVAALAAESSSSDSDSSGSGSGAEGGDAAEAAAPEVAAQKAEEKNAAKEEKRKARALEGLKLASKEKAAADAAAASSSAGAVSGAAAPEEPESKLAGRKSSAFGHVLEDATEFNNDKVKKARAEEKKRKKTVQQSLSIEDERNRKYGSLAAENTAGELSPEEYEAYRLERTRSDDPMANFK